MSTRKGILIATSSIVAILSAAVNAVAQDSFSEFLLRGSGHHDTPIGADDDLLAWKLRTAGEAIRSGSLLNSTQPLVGKNTAKNIEKLDEFLRSSIDNSDVLKASVHDAAAVSETSKEARFELLPTISLEVSSTYQDQSSFLNQSSNRALNSRAAITASWTIFSQEASWSAIQAASLDAVAADLRFLETERQVLLENAMVYTALYASQQTVAAIRQTLNRLNRIRDSIARQFKAGFASRSDIAQIQAEIGSVEAQLQAALSTVEQQRIAYKDAAGQKAPSRVSAPKVSGLVPGSKEATVERALRGNLSIDAAEATYRAEEERSNATRNQFLPSVGVFASLSTQDNPVNTFNNGDDFTIGLNLTAPLVDYRIMPRYKRSREVALAAKYRARDAHRQITRAVETSWAAFQGAKKQRNALVKREKALLRSLTGIRAQVDAGLRSISDLLREEIELTNNAISIAQLDMEIHNNAFAIAAQFSDLSLDEFVN